MSNNEKNPDLGTWFQNSGGDRTSPLRDFVVSLGCQVLAGRDIRQGPSSPRITDFLEKVLCGTSPIELLAGAPKDSGVRRTFYGAAGDGGHYPDEILPKVIRDGLSPEHLEI